MFSSSTRTGFSAAASVVTGAPAAKVLALGMTDEELVRLTLGGFRAAHDQLTAEEFLIVQLLDGTLGFLDRLHVDESETF